jgi:hypothetical protein
MNRCGAHLIGTHLVGGSITATGCRRSASPFDTMSGGQAGCVHASKESTLDAKQAADVRDIGTTCRDVIELALSSLVRTRDTLSMSAAVARVWYQPGIGGTGRSGSFREQHSPICPHVIDPVSAALPSALAGKPIRVSRRRSGVGDRTGERSPCVPAVAYRKDRGNWSQFPRRITSHL